MSEEKKQISPTRGSPTAGVWLPPSEQECSSIEVVSIDSLDGTVNSPKCGFSIPSTPIGVGEEVKVSTPDELDDESPFPLQAAESCRRALFMGKDPMLTDKDDQSDMENLDVQFTLSPESDHESLGEPFPEIFEGMLEKLDSSSESYDEENEHFSYEEDSEETSFDEDSEATVYDDESVETLSDEDKITEDDKN